MGIPDHLPCLLRSLYVDQEATARTGHGTMDWFKTGKGVLASAAHILKLNDTEKISMAPAQG